MSDLTLETFLPLVGTSFDVATPEANPIQLRLREAEALTGPETRDVAEQPQTTGFSLVFEGAPDTPLPQGLYELCNPDLGTCAALFMTPVICSDPSVRHYQVIFNHLVAR